jgi:hypothetical protein
MTRRLLVCLFGLAVASSAITLAQEAPKPGPEHERLGFWVGDWTDEGEVKENPMMPGGKMTSKNHCEWFEGNFAVVCHSEGKGPMGPTKSIGIIGYSSETKVYTYYAVDNSGMAMTTVPKGKVDGKTWVYDDESTMEGQQVKTRYTMVETSTTSYTFKWEMLGPDGKWMTIMAGTGKKS